MSIQDFVQYTSNIILDIFRDEYGITLNLYDLHWLHSPNQPKFSMHLVISTHSPQLVYASGVKADTQSAFHLAHSIRQRDPHGPAGRFVDLAVYTPNRLMRMSGSKKIKRVGDEVVKKHSVLQPMQANSEAADSVITWLDDDVRIIPVPEAIPAAIQRRGTPRTVRAFHDAERYQPESIVLRMLELLRHKVHPSAFHEPSHGAEDALDSRVGIKFNHTDRREKCYTGETHEGTQNCRCFIRNDDVYMKCFSDRCQRAPAFLLGPLASCEPEYEENAVYIHSRYLSCGQDSEDGRRFDTALDTWVDGRAKCLNIKSAMSTGKSLLLSSLIKRVGPRTVLVITYRQSLAMEMKRKLATAGFVMYMDVPHEASLGLDDESAFPRVIVQLDSLWRLSRMSIRQFDLIILDEQISLMQHVSSESLRQRQFILHLFTFRQRCASSPWMRTGTRLATNSSSA